METCVQRHLFYMQSGVRKYMGGEVFSIFWNFVAGTGAGCVLVTLKIVHRMNMVKIFIFAVSLFSRLCIVAQNEVKYVPDIGETVLILWGVFTSYEHKIISCYCLGEAISFTILMVWGTGGVGNRSVLCCGTHEWTMQTVDVIGCTAFSLLRRFGRGDCYNTIVVVFSCSPQYNGNSMFNQKREGVYMWDFVIKGGLILWRGRVHKDYIFQIGFTAILCMSFNYRTEVVEKALKKNNK